MKLLMLQIPPTVVTWILRDSYIQGTEFTMGGKKMRLEKIVCPDDGIDDSAPDEKTSESNPEKNNDATSESSDGAKIISLENRKR